MVWTVLNDCDDKTTLPNYLKDLYSREPQQVDSLLSTLINPYDTKNALDVEYGFYLDNILSKLSR